MKAAWSVLALGLFFPVTGQAQSALAAGARVRITSPRNDLQKHVTTVTEVRGDSIVVAGQAGVRAVALSDVTAIEVSTGRRNRIVRDGLIGLGAGFAGGFLLGALTYEGPDFLVGSSMEAGALLGTFFGVVGLITGGVVGAFDHADRWQPVQGALKASIGPTRSGGVSLALSRAF
ncbi:MAG TPA: hypothetical protein VMY38_00520 [Gemmatimonadaceae bacterium]|nr:hypothetical protein [Gemmatimonadaceae bacterium]